MSSCRRQQTRRIERRALIRRSYAILGASHRPSPDGYCTRKFSGLSGRNKEKIILHAHLLTCPEDCKILLNSDSASPVTSGACHAWYRTKRSENRIFIFCERWTLTKLQRPAKTTNTSMMNRSLRRPCSLLQQRRGAKRHELDRWDDNVLQKPNGSAFSNLRQCRRKNKFQYFRSYHTLLK